MINLYTGIPDDFKPDYLTIDEMREIANQDKYRKEWERANDNSFYSPVFHDENTNLTYCDSWYDRYTGLHRHIWVEEYMECDFEKVDWERATHRYDFRAIAEIISIYTHPLIWTNSILEPDNYIIYGKVALPVSNYEEFDSRIYLSEKWLNKIMDMAVLYFADTLPQFKTDDLSRGIKEGMHYWHYLMLDLDKFSTYILYDYDHFRSFSKEKPYFCADTLLKSIRLIKEQRGNEKAAQILNLFQSEWDDIELLDTYHFANYTTQQITKFKRLLFKGFNRDLGLPEYRQERPANIVVRGDYVVGNKYVNTDEK